MVICSENYQKPWLIQRARGCFATQVSLNLSLLSLSFECEFVNELEL